MAACCGAANAGAAPPAHRAPATDAATRRKRLFTRAASHPFTHARGSSVKARVPLQSAAVAGQRVKLLVQDRAVLGSAESRRLRKQGLIPGILYGRERPHAISIVERDLRNALTGGGGMNAVLDVVIDGGSVHSSVLKEYQLHNVRGKITHVDLQEVRLDQPIH